MLQDGEGRHQVNIVLKVNYFKETQTTLKFSF
jgi:hypothetical protein